MIEVVNTRLPVLRVLFAAFRRRFRSGVLVGCLAGALPTLAQPAIVATVPPDGATNVAGSAPVIFQFNTNMNTTATFALFHGTMREMAATWSADGRWLTNTPSEAFAGGAAITWAVYGQSVAGELLMTIGGFTTGSGSPWIVASVPPANATDVSPSAPVILTFSAPMNPAQTLVQFLDASAFPPKFLTTTPSWSADHVRLTNTPVQPFPANALINWYATGEDTSGQSLDLAVNGGFMTSSGGSVAPTIVLVSPENGATNVSPNAPVIFEFSTAMNPNATAVQFADVTAPTVPLPVVTAWSADGLWLTNTPSPAFPADAIIMWSASGQDLAGTALQETGGAFWTATPGGGTNNPFSGVALFSRGETAEQTDTNSFEPGGPEFLARAGEPAGTEVAVVSPTAQATNILSLTVPAGTLEFADSEAGPFAFATNYPAGVYQCVLNTDSGAPTAAITLNDDSLPPVPRLLNWQNTPHAVLDQPVSLQWTLDGGGAAVDYLRLRIEQDGIVVFDTPLPHSAGALTAASNSVVVPASVFTNAGAADVSLTAFSFTAIDTNTISGFALRAARHRTTTFELRVVDGLAAPPVLLATNLVAVPVGEPVMYPLVTTNGAGPMRFEQIAGTLPPGLTLGAEGSLQGQAVGAGTFNATLRVTDLLGQNTTQSLRVVTALMPSLAAPWIEDVGRGTRSTVRFDLVGGAGSDCQIEQSTNLLNWTTYLSTNPPSDRVRLQVPIQGEVVYFRVSRPGAPPPLAPHPLAVFPVLNSNVTASAPIDSFGGALSLTNGGGYVFTLTVPPGALDWPESISMTDVAQVGGLPMGGGLRAGVDLQPEGLMFSVPARLDIAFPTTLNSNALLGFGARNDGQEFALDYLTLSNRTVSLNLLHFSMGGAGEGDSGDGQAQGQNAPSDPMAAMRQQLEQQRQACLADPSCDPLGDTDRLRALMVLYADQTVLPKLRYAVQEPYDNVVEDALVVWLEWCRQLSLLGLTDDPFAAVQPDTELGKRLCHALGLASQALANGVNKGCKDCMENDISSISSLLNFARTAALLGWNNIESKAYDCIRKCLVFELKIESEIVLEGSAGTLSTHTKATVKLKSLADTSGFGVPAELNGKFAGQGRWNITQVHDLQTKCPMTSAPSSGRAVAPLVILHFYKQRERTVWVPGKGAVKFITSILDPNLEVNLNAGLALMPDEGRVEHCPKDPPANVAQVFGPAFITLHADEITSPQPGSLTESVLGGPVFKIRDFQQSGAGNVLFSKAYFKTVSFKDGVATENTLIELRHAPKP